MSLRVAAAAIFAAFLLAACGEDEAPELETAQNPAVALAERIPEGPVAAVTAVDLAAARDALGLPPDAAPIGASPDDSGEELRFASVVGTAIPHLGQPRDVPVAEAIDPGEVTAAASSAFSGPEAVTVLATEQPFDEIAASLEDAGYRREGEVLQTLESGTEVVHTIVAGGDGVVAMGGDLELVSSAAEGETPSPSGTDRELLASLAEAPAISAVGSRDACVEGFAVADELAGGRGEMEIVAAGEASADRFAADRAKAGPLADFEFEDPRVDAQSVTVPFTYPLSVPGTPLAVVTGELPSREIYDCA
jgi:hypothetical protein